MKVSEELLRQRMNAYRTMLEVVMRWTNEYESVKKFNETKMSAYEEAALGPILKLTRRYEEAIGGVIHDGFNDILDEVAKIQAQGYPAVGMKAQGGS